MIPALYIVVYAIFAVSVYFSSSRNLHMAQLEGYKPRQYWWWIKHNLKYAFFKELVILIPGFLSYGAYRLVGSSMAAEASALIVWAAANGYVIYMDATRKKEAKKPLVYTHRAVRLLVMNFLLLALWGTLSFIKLNNIMYIILILSAVRFLLPFNMLLSTLLIYPFEMLVHYRYFRYAQLKIRKMKNLKVVAITGSYGKTSTKYFLKTILSEKYNTIMTPESYNTPMGITKVIREQLNDRHEVFVCEMGARNVGDIRTLCKLVNPSIGILTSIGPQHLETFKSIENVAKTKYELIEALPYDGAAIFNGDNSYCYELAEKTGIETYIYGIENKGEEVFITAGEIRNSKEGLKFKVTGQEGIEFDCSTRLLGKHNVSNILAAICAAIRLGLTPEEIKKGIMKIEPVPHRLQLLDTNNGITVIDDAFNSNPSGAKEALEVIKDFTDGKRIVITPGMVELGSVECEENKKFGRVMADCCDIAILVGIKRSKPIIAGLKEGNFPDERIIVAADLNEATAKMGAIVKAGDVVLFENDLPDNYIDN